MRAKIARVRGTVHYRDLEGGFWQLVAEDGSRYTLLAPPAELRQEGARVEVEGTVEEGFGIAMAGPELRVKSFRNL